MERKWVAGGTCVRRLKEVIDPFLQAMCRAVFPLWSTNRESHPAFRRKSTSKYWSIITARWRGVWEERIKLDFWPGEPYCIAYIYCMILHYVYVLLFYFSFLIIQFGSQVYKKCLLSTCLWLFCEFRNGSLWHCLMIWMAWSSASWIMARWRNLLNSRGVR